ncbi:MAG: hypothetical protein E6I42_06840, partial [Chloroflexi bacterium]
VRRLTASAVTTIWNAPYSRQQAVDTAEFSASDAIIGLDIKQIAERELRVLQVLKLRGSDFQSGEHMYRVTRAGIEVFPRLADAQIGAGYALSPKPTPTGIAALDDLLGKGGFWTGASTLVAGPTGIGKTILSQQVAFRNATTERPALFFSTMSEPLDKIVRFGSTLEFFDPKALQDGRMMYEDLGQVLGEGGLDDAQAAIDRQLKERRPGIVVIDSVRAFHALAADLSSFRQFLHALVRRLTASAVTSPSSTVMRSTIRDSCSATCSARPPDDRQLHPASGAPQNVCTMRNRLTRRLDVDHGRCSSALCTG